MKRVRLALASAVTASLFAACEGANFESPASSIPQIPKTTAATRNDAPANGWTPVTASAPFTHGASSEIQMTDGTVLVQDYCSANWYPLVPDKSGSYINGTWGPKTSMPSTYTPVGFASAILPDAKLIVEGGEYYWLGSGCFGSYTNEGAIYDPFAKTWKSVSPPSGWSRIGDAPSTVLANGAFLLADCCTYSQALLDEASMTWRIVGKGKADNNNEEGWTLLRNGEVLVADVSSAPNSELFNLNSNSWSTAGNLPENVTQGYEIGPQTLMTDNDVFVIGANEYTAIYNASTGKWSEGPNNPTVGGTQYDAADAPSSLLPDGEGMIAESPGLNETPVRFFLFTEQNFKAIPNPPNAPNDSSPDIRLLVLPTGQILETDQTNDVEIYTSKGAPVESGRPEISSVPTTLTHGRSYTIGGKRFNGLSQANFFGDDDQQATNYPLVRIANTKSGTVAYARTHGFSYMGVGSNRNVSAMFDEPSKIETGASTLQVVTNGIASTPVDVTIR